MINLSSAMGRRFAEVVQEISQRIHALGPSPLEA
jgi:coenzyme F420-reducing hydrogenase delta subunit